MHSLVDRLRDREFRNTAFKHSYSKRARISSLADVLAGPELLPLDGGVFRSGGSKYDRSSIGSTLSGSNCKKRKTFVRVYHRKMFLDHFYCHCLLAC